MICRFTYCKLLIPIINYPLSSFLILSHSVKLAMSHTHRLVSVQFYPYLPIQSSVGRSEWPLPGWLPLCFVSDLLICKLWEEFRCLSWHFHCMLVTTPFIFVLTLFVRFLGGWVRYTGQCSWSVLTSISVQFSVFWNQANGRVPNSMDCADWGVIRIKNVNKCRKINLRNVYICHFPFLQVNGDRPV